MKTLVFSDTHLGLDHVFEEKKYRFLEQIIRDSDSVIINGDFWEGCFITFDQFKNSPYRHLFPLLKAKKTVYIPGNHDDLGLHEKGTSLFADKTTLRHEITLGNNNLVFEHGDRQIQFFSKNHHPENKAMNEINKQYLRLIDKIEKTIVRKLRKIPAVQFFQKKLNEVIKKNMKKSLRKDQIFVCGHTHLAEFNPNEKFINTGMIKYGLGQYMMIENNTLTPHETWYD